MKINVGIVIPLEVSEFFHSILSDFTELTFRIVTYERDDEIPDVLAANQNHLDAIVFGGPLSYWASRNHVRESTPTVCIEFGHSELLKGLLSMQMKHSSTPLNRVSFDTFSERTVREVFEELDVQVDQVFISAFDPGQPYQCIFEIHQQLWRDGRVDEVITCRRSVAKLLKQAGIPHIIVLPTRFNVKECITRAALLGENTKNIESQAAVAIFHLNINGSSSVSPEYEVGKLSLDFHRKLLDFSQHLGATIVSANSLEYMLYANRGSTEDIVQRWIDDPYLSEVSTLFQQKSTSISVGFGMGQTVIAAKANARRAVQRAKLQGGNCGYLIREDGEVIGPLGKMGTMHFVHKTDSKELQRISEQSSLTVETVSKMVEFSKKHREFTVEDLARALSVTTRSARNFINKLSSLGYITSTGEEKPYPKGRPRKIFSLRVE